MVGAIGAGHLDEGAAGGGGEASRMETDFLKSAERKIALNVTGRMGLKNHR